MKLAEALSKIAALTSKVQQLRDRLSSCLKVQEGDTPSEMPTDVVVELDNTLDELQQLIYRINMTNSKTELDGTTITSLLAKRDILSMRTRTLNHALTRLTEREDRYARNEIRYVRTMDVNELRKLYDTSAAQLRKLDLTIQSIGWTTDLLENV